MQVITFLGLALRYTAVDHVTIVASGEALAKWHMEFTQWLPKKYRPPIFVVSGKNTSLAARCNLFEPDVSPFETTFSVHEVASAIG